MELREAGGDSRVAQTHEMIGAGPGGEVRDKLVVVAAEEIDIPFDGGAELRIEVRAHAEFPKVKNTQLESGVRGEPTEPWAVVLGGVGEHHGEAARVDGRWHYLR